MNRTMKVFLACALGALIGALCALELAHRFSSESLGWLFGTIGAIVGGLVSYLSYNIKEVFVSIRKRALELWSWRPNSVYWKPFFQFLWRSSIALGGSGVIAGIILDVFGERARLLNPNLNGLSVTAVVLGVVGQWIAVCMSHCAASRIAQKLPQAQERFEDDAKLLWMLNIIGIPLAFLCWCIFSLLPESIIDIKNKISDFYQLGKRVFIDIHGSERTLCFLDGAIGALIGYSYGSALVGTLVGGVLGVINYEVVSIRLLKLRRV